MEIKNAPKKLTFSLIIPTLNEVTGMRVIMPQIDRSLVDEILIVDGGSTDGTVEYSKEHGYTVVPQTSPNGCTGAILDGFRAAKGDIFITFSPDGNSLPEKLPELIEKMKEGYDMVIVSRYLGGHKSEDDDIVTAFGNKLFTWLINFLFGGKYTDVLVMYRAYKRQVPEMLNLSVDEYGGIEPCLSVGCAKYKLRTADIYGFEPKRIGGIRKLVPLYHGFWILIMIAKQIITPIRKKETAPVNHA